MVMLSTRNLPIDAIAEVCQRYRVREMALFGSALREDFSMDSDIDLLVEFEEDAQIGFMALSRLQRELSTLLGRRVDLVLRNGLKPIIRQEILSTAELLYAA